MTISKAPIKLDRTYDLRKCCAFRQPEKRLRRLEVDTVPSHGFTIRCRFELRLAFHQLSFPQLVYVSTTDMFESGVDIVPSSAIIKSIVVRIGFESDVQECAG